MEHVVSLGGGEAGLGSKYCTDKVQREIEITKLFVAGEPKQMGE